MAAVEMVQFDEVPCEAPVHLRIISGRDDARTYPRTVPLGVRRAARDRMLRQRRRTLAVLVLVTCLVVLAWPGHAFGGTTGAGLSTDLANSSVLASGMDYVVQPGDSVHSIAALMNPVEPRLARAALVHELRSSVVVAGEHIVIP